MAWTHGSRAAANAASLAASPPWRRRDARRKTAAEFFASTHASRSSRSASASFAFALHPFCSDAIAPMKSNSPICAAPSTAWPRACPGFRYTAARASASAAPFSPRAACASARATHASASVAPLPSRWTSSSRTASAGRPSVSASRAAATPSLGCESFPPALAASGAPPRSAASSARR